MSKIIHYVSDPMCSWCYAFRGTIDALSGMIPDTVSLNYVMGGLAPDSDDPMPKEVQGFVQENWRMIENRTGTRFNWDFWEKCKPRRSTYPACRGVLAAGLQNPEWKGPMFTAIQQAYYELAENPSDYNTLIEVFRRLALGDVDLFAQSLQTPEVEALLQQDFELRRRLGARSFPSLVLESGDQLILLQAGWNEESEVKRALLSHLGQS